MFKCCFKMVDNPMNLSSLQQQDPLVIEILGTASQTHIYNYDNVLNKWVKCLKRSIFFSSVFKC